MGGVTNIDGTKHIPPEQFFVRRGDPNITGPFHAGILLEAANSTMIDIFRKERYSRRSRVPMLLKPAEITHPNAPYEQRILVMWRMIRLIEDEDARSDLLKHDGWIYDKNSGRIREYETEPYLHITYRYYPNSWEYYVNTAHPNNFFAMNIRDENIKGNIENFSLLKRIRSENKGEDLFGGKGLEFLLDAWTGWKLPIIGVRKLIFLEPYKKRYTISSDGVTVEEIPDRTDYIRDHPYFKIDKNTGAVQEPDLGRILEFKPNQNNLFF